MKTILSVLLTFFGQDTIRRLVVEILRLLAKQTDNTIDDKFVALFDAAMNNRQDLDALKLVYEQWSGQRLPDTKNNNQATE